MADRATKRRKNKDEKASDGEDKPTKLEKKVAHWLRRNVPTKKTKFMHSHDVSFFIGSRAVSDLLNKSPWSKSKLKNPEKSELVFDTREGCIAFMDQLLKLKMFHRAIKIQVEEVRKKKKTDDKSVAEKANVKKDVGKSPKKGKESGNETDEAPKKKRKIRLEMHSHQVFLDSNEAYVWLYDPMPWYYWVVGTIIVLGVIGICLFPLWPPSLRLGVHYLSLAAAGFLIFLIGLGLLKYVVFAILFFVTMGKLKLWIFPNLTEDVGFFESFVPMYEMTWTGGKKKDKDSDDEEEEEDDSENEQDEKKGSGDGGSNEEKSSSDEDSKKN